MTIDDAIKRLTNEANTAWNDDRLSDADACQLGIEALKRLKFLRSLSHNEGTKNLPGETT